MTDLSLVAVNKRSQLRQFISFPFSLYAQDPHWAPPLLMDQKKMLSRKAPFFDSGQAQLFLAMRGNKVVGRISAHFSEAHLSLHGDDAGFFGWYECEHDEEASRALLDAARNWLRVSKPDLTTIRGPYNWDLNGERPGLLIDDRDPGLPVFLMAYNPQYYVEQLETSGFEKAMDLYAYRANSDEVHEPLGRMAKILEKRLGDIEMRPLDMGSGFKHDIESVRRIYSAAWADNWGALPLSEREMKDIASGLKMLVRPDMTRIVLHEGQAIGTIICLPDLSPALRAIKGRLFPFGFLKLLKAAKHKLEIRTMLMGVDPAWRRKGVEALMVNGIIESARARGKVTAELSWVLETNDGMNRFADKLGAELYRTYRIFEAPL